MPARSASQPANPGDPPGTPAATPPTPPGPRCSASKRDGTPCRGRPQPGKGVCAFHDAARAGEFSEGRRRGGVNRSRPPAVFPPDAPDLPLRTVAEVSAALAEAFNAVRTGRLDCRVGNCLGVLAGVIMKALEGSELERQVSQIEAAKSAKPGGAS